MTNIKTLLNTRSFRSVDIRNPEVTESGLTIELVASSDVPYLRQFGYETLLHTDDAVDYTRVMAGACPLLYNHKNDQYIGIVEKVWLVDGQLRASVRLSKNSDLARQITADITDGILKSISIGYEINELQEVDPIKDIPQFVATRWTLYEVSVVTTPADYQKAGIGRSDHPINEDSMKKRELAEVMEMVDTLTDDEKAELLTELVADVVEPLTEEVMEDTPIEDVLMEEDEVDEKEMMEEEQVKSAPKAKTHRSTKGDTMSMKNTGSDNGADNIAKLADIAAKYNRTADLATWVREGRSASDVALEIVESRSNTDKVTGPAIHVKKNDNTLAGAVKSWLQGNNSELAERGIDQARASGRTVTPGTLYIPTDVPMIRAGTAYTNTGKNATGIVYQTFEETLREGALLSQVGGQILALNDVSTMPYFSTPATARVNLHETGSVTEDEVEVGLRTWAPKRIAARYVFSNLLGRLNGTYDFEAELYNDLVAEGVRQFDAQIWGGAGTLEILGLTRDTNISALNLTGSMSLASASAMITEVATQNANVANGAFVVDHVVYSQLFSTPSFGAGSGESVLTVIQASNPVFRTGYLPEVITGKKAALFGDFSKVTAATFGPVEIKRDDLTKAQTGQTVLHMEMFADCVARNPKALVRWNNITG
jgi:HK97 family phage prohead protease